MTLPPERLKGGSSAAIPDPIGNRRHAFPKRPAGLEKCRGGRRDKRPIRLTGMAFTQRPPPSSPSPHAEARAERASKQGRAFHEAPGAERAAGTMVRALMHGDAADVGAARVPAGDAPYPPWAASACCRAVSAARVVSSISPSASPVM